MRKQKRLLAVVVALAMMVTIGAGSGITAQAAGCSHSSVEIKHVSSSNPMYASHSVYVEDEATGGEVYMGECEYIYQYHTMAIWCPDCKQVLATYEECSEMHSNSSCPKH